MLVHRWCCRREGRNGGGEEKMEDGGGCSSGTRGYCMKRSVKRGICAGIPSADVCCVGWIGDGGKRELVGRNAGTEVGRKSCGNRVTPDGQSTKIHRLSASHSNPLRLPKRVPCNLVPRSFSIIMKIPDKSVLKPPGIRLDAARQFSGHRPSPTIINRSKKSYLT